MEISAEYIRASELQRWELFRGLMNSAGYIGSFNDQSIYVTNIRHLAESIRELLWPLGIRNSITSASSARFGNWYTISFAAIEKLNKKTSGSTGNQHAPAFIISRILNRLTTQ